MATVARLSIPGDAFPLGVLFRTFPGATVELERVVPTTEALVPYVWIHNADPDTVTEALEEQPEILGIELLDTIDDRVLFRIQWKPEVEGLVRGLATSDITLLRGIARENGWTFDIREERSGGLSAFDQYCSEHDVAITVTKLGEATLDADASLTPEQREALLLAYDRGYFDLPRRTTLAELADEIGISRQSLSARLRRGHHTLITGVADNGDGVVADGLGVGTDKRVT